MKTRKILVTSGLLYANGSMHLGHVIEQVQTDIWARFQRMQGHDVLYVCGEDAHGTPIMINAEKQGLTPEALIAAVDQEHRADIHDFLIHIDSYYTTHSQENRELATLIYEKLKERGDISTKLIEQAFDPEKNMYLPDRYVKGECPSCHASDQYGDSCEICGATYIPTDLINPVSVLTGTTPTQKQSLHYFFELEHYEAMLREWTQGGHLQPEVANKLNEWFKTGLQAWDISRDAPYFGFEIPNSDNKYFYVWMDAPIGYMASLKNLCDKRDDLNFNDYWRKDSKAEVYHFVGKDIVYFHALFWPAMLSGAGFRIPTAIFTHGFVTINGQKMSKSRGTFIKARTYLNYLDAEYLRYYFAAKLTSRIDDIDLNWDDFMLRVNADMVGKVVNIASRSAGFIKKNFSGILTEKLSHPKLYAKLVNASQTIAMFYEKREYSKAVRHIMELADSVNQYIDEQKPWVLAKEQGKEQEVQNICSMGLNCFRLLIIYLKPILPRMAGKVEEFLNCEPLKWDDIHKPLLGTKINPFKPLMQRLTQEQIEAMLNESKQ